MGWLGKTSGQYAGRWNGVVTIIVVVVPPAFPTPNFGGGGGSAGGRPNSRNHSMRPYFDSRNNRYDVPIADHDEDDEEAIIIAILIQVAHEIH